MADSSLTAETAARVVLIGALHSFNAHRTDHGAASQEAPSGLRHKLQLGHGAVC